MRDIFKTSRYIFFTLALASCAGNPANLTSDASPPTRLELLAGEDEEDDVTVRYCKGIVIEGNTIRAVNMDGSIRQDSGWPCYGRSGGWGPSKNYYHVKDFNEGKTYIVQDDDTLRLVFDGGDQPWYALFIREHDWNSPTAIEWRIKHANDRLN